MQKFLWVFLTFSISLPVWAMKRKEPETCVPHTQKTQVIKPYFDFQEMATLEKLPSDAQKLILLQVINNAPNAREAAHEIRKIGSISRTFRTLITRADFNEQLILAIANRFTHGNVLAAAEILGTTAALAWSSKILPEVIRKNVLQILDKLPIDEDDLEEGMIEKTIQDIINYLNSDASLKQVAHNPYVMIWLLRAILKKVDPLTEVSITATELAQKMYPHEIQSELVKKWLAYQDKQIATTFDILIAYQNVDLHGLEPLKKLRSQGIDILDPAYIAEGWWNHIISAGLPLLEFLIHQGINFNQQDTYGETILHRLMKNIEVSRPSSGLVLMDKEQQQARLNLLKRVLQTNPNTNIINNEGYTPLEIAQFQYGQTDLAPLRDYFRQIIEMLKAYQKKKTT